MNKKAALFKSAIALLLCLSMLIGTTFAWFTDNVTSTGNIITSGTLDVEMYWTDDLDRNVWYNVEDAGYNTIFSYDNWEPGYTDVRYIKIVNKGDLAMNYKLTIAPQNEVGKLAEVINVYFADAEVELKDRNDLSNLRAIGLLSNVLNGGATADGTLLPANQKNDEHPSGEVIVTMAMNMITTAGNDYQGKDAGDFTITVMATQASVEKDSFGSNYDGGAIVEVLGLDRATIAVTPVDGRVPAGGATLTGSNVSAFVPAGVALANGADKLTLTVSPLNNSSTGFSPVNDEVLIPVDVHIDGIAKNNTVPVVINLGAILPKHLNMGNYRLYHVENGVNSAMTLVDNTAELTAHNTFTYDPLTGEVSVAMATFSEVAIVANTMGAWEGKFDYSWYDATKTELTIANADQLAAFGAIVGGMAKDIERDSFVNKTVTLLSDINLNNGTVLNDADGTTKTIFYPIGYYNNKGFTNENINGDKGNRPTTVEGTVESTVYSFAGTFDGNGHKISNFYQNTWEMFGDYNSGYSGTPNYYKDAMGLFGYVYGGTIKNLTVDNFESDGEFTPTGVIAAYADGNATFENIAITNCNPRVYNTGNGGIIGIAGDTSVANDDHISLKNITVDNSNTISALWGSYDVACGGLVGMYRGNVDGSGNATGDTISFDNCHVAAKMDVYNDVCGNYQYYWYRYSGMIIGSIRHNKTVGDYVQPDMTGITANGCTVHFGEWNNYYYCEFEKNGHPSYSGPDDYKFSRVDNSELVIENGKVTGCSHNHTDVENNRAIYLPFDQLFTGYGWGVKSQGLKELEGITILDINLGDREESVEKFESLFTGDFLYRVGNQNAVSVGSLFAAKEGAGIVSSGVVVSIDKIDENANVSGTFTANTSDWTKGTIQFNGTGVVKVTIQDYNFCTPTVLYLEIVDAVNATGATSATSNNVVLLNDCGFSSLEVSGGYTLFGNGFTMTCGSDSAALDMGYSFVTLNNGTLDNVQIVTPNFDHAVLYKANMTESSNRSETTDRTRYYNVKSGVMVTGNSQILSSRISGARAAVNVAGGNCLIENSRIELGAVASLLIGSANSVTLRDITLVQKPTASTHDSSKTLMGFSVLFICDENGNATPVTVEGTLVQNAWVDESKKTYIPSGGESLISAIMSKTAYLHDLNNDGTAESLNLGFAYMPESTGKSVNKPKVTDNRTNKDTISYALEAISTPLGTPYVFSYKNTNGTADNFKTTADYKPNKQGDIIEVNYSDTNEHRVLGKVFGENGWVYQLSVDLDQGAYTFDFTKLTVQKNNVALGIDRSDKVVVEEGTTTYTLTLTDGSAITFKLIGIATTKDAPQWSSDANGSALSTSMNASWEAGVCVASKKGGTWHGAAPALQNVYVRYYSTEAKTYKVIHLADYTPNVTGKVNGTNTTCTITGPDFTLTLTGGQVHSSNNVFAIPVVCNSKLYFLPATSSGLVNSGNSARAVPVSYSFTDGFGNTLTGSHTWSVAEDKNNEKDYSKFCEGTMTAASSGSSTCIAEGSMITMADGSKKAVENIRRGDLVMAFDHVTGKVVYKEVALVGRTYANEYYKSVFVFDDGTKLNAINEHGIYDLDLNCYVNIGHDNYQDYVGHRFVSVDSNGNVGVKRLVDVVSTVESGYKYDIVTNETLTYVVEDTLSVSHEIVMIMNSFAFGGNMTYDAEAMQSDIEKYGLYTYEDFAEYCDRETFEKYNMAIMKVGAGKGLYTYEHIVYLLTEIALNDSVQII